MFPSSAAPNHDTSNASALADEYYHDRSDFIYVAGLNRRNDEFGTDGAETIYGTDGSDAMDGHVANPEVDGGDVLVGGLGNDIYFVSDTQTRVVEEAGSGFEVVVMNVSFNLDEHLNAAGEVSEIENFEFWGGGSGVVLNAASSTWDMNTRVHGGADVITNITTITGSGNDQVNGSVGDDIFMTGAGDDYVFASAGNDTIYGGAGIDRLRGGEGDDTLTGGLDPDEFYFSVSDGAQSDVVMDWEAGIDHAYFGDIDYNHFSMLQVNDGVLLSYSEEATVLFVGQDLADMSISDFTLYYDDAGSL
jgi:Ca2+-binding RTX toxin-like protein